MKKLWIAASAAAALSTSPVVARPGPIAQAAPVTATNPDTVTTAEPSSNSPFSDVEPVSGGELNAVTGQADLAMVVRAQNTSTVSNNSVSGESQTGGIAFDAGSLSSLNGLSLLSANTGNNVSINSSLNVNIAIQP